MIICFLSSKEELSYKKPWINKKCMIDENENLFTNILLILVSRRNKYIGLWNA